MPEGPAERPDAAGGSIIAPDAWTLPALPFFDARHTALAQRVDDFLGDFPGDLPAQPETEGAAEGRAASLATLRCMAQAGLLDALLPPFRRGALPDLRAISLVREALAFADNRLATLFIVQAMGVLPLYAAGDEGLAQTTIDRARAGAAIGAIAVSEAQAGTDLAQLRTTAVRAGDGYLLDGEKAWVANGAIADHLLVLARVGAEGPLAAFLVERDRPGVTVRAVTRALDGTALATVAFERCALPAGRLLGGPGEALRAVMAGFDLFRVTVGAAATGVAKRALAETLRHVKARRMFGGRMCDLDGVQMTLAGMRAGVEAAELAVYRAAWRKDTAGGRITAEAALAKLVATTAASRVVDRAVQLAGAAGVAEGGIVARLWRDVRPMEIYEGANEIQRKIIARAMIAD